MSLATLFGCLHSAVLPLCARVRMQAASPNHSFRDKDGKDLFRACMANLVSTYGSDNDTDAMMAIKGPMSLVYPDPVSALYGKPLAYNHPVPASFCNNICPLSSMVQYAGNGE